jgi:hypothetical protein
MSDDVTVGVENTDIGDGPLGEVFLATRFSDEGLRRKDRRFIVPFRHKKRRVRLLVRISH